MLPAAASAFPWRQLGGVKDVDNLNGFPSYAVHNAVGCFDEFANAASFVGRAE